MMIDTELLLHAGATIKKFVANEMIFRENETGNFYYQVLEGSVRWVNINADGTEFIQGMVSTGESFGEFTLFDGQPYSSSAIANTGTAAMRLYRQDFWKLLKDYPEILQKFTTLFVERLRFKTMLLNEISHFGPERRIAALLSYFKKANKTACCDCNKVMLTRQQIANMTGLRVETVIRAMQKMKEKGYVFIEKGKVFINYEAEPVPVKEGDALPTHDLRCNLI